MRPTVLSNENLPYGRNGLTSDNCCYALPQLETQEIQRHSRIPGKIFVVEFCPSIVWDSELLLLPSNAQTCPLSPLWRGPYKRDALYYQSIRPTHSLLLVHPCGHDTTRPRRHARQPTVDIYGPTDRDRFIHLSVPFRGRPPTRGAFAS